jgi:tetratricopeptide (TPR) repeat protein
MSASEQPLVSILIRSMDRPTLQRALDSAAAQTWPNLEIVVVAASGRTHRPLPAQHQGRPLRLVVAEGGDRLPRAQAANLALESAQGEWLNFLDDDDELLPRHVETLLAEPRPDADRVIYSRTRVVDANGTLLGHISHAGNHVQLYFHNRATTCATLLHRSLVDEGVRFDDSFRVHEDHDFQVACATQTPFRFVDEATCTWHADAGESGCGFGANDDDVQRQESVQKIRRKWAATFERWLADADAVLYAGQQYLAAGDFALAIACFDQVLYVRAGDVNALNLGGMAHFRAGNLDRAEQLFSEALRRLPGHAGLQGNLDLLRRKRAEGAAHRE